VRVRVRVRVSQAFMDGYCMGGGVGLSMHGAVRIAGLFSYNMGLFLYSGGGTSERIRGSSDGIFNGYCMGDDQSLSMRSAVRMAGVFSSNTGPFYRV